MGGKWHALAQRLPFVPVMYINKRDDTSSFSLMTGGQVVWISPKTDLSSVACLQIKILRYWCNVVEK